MSTYRIATIPGDGIGVDVTAEAVKVVDAVLPGIEWTEFDWSCEQYLRTGHMDAVGGELNAFTAKEQTCYYAHVLDEDLPLAVDLVSDVVLNGLCRAEDVSVERQVVLEEISMRDDDPEDMDELAAGHGLRQVIVFD